MNQKSELSTFEDMATEKIPKLSNFVNIRISLKSPSSAKARAILGGDLTDKDVARIRTLCNFAIMEPELISKIIDDSELSNDKIDTLKDAIQDLRDKINLLIMDINKEHVAPKTDNERAFEKFLKTHLTDPKYAGKYVAFVHGKFQKYGNDEIKLIKEMYDKFGNVAMHVDKVTSSRRVAVMATPKFL